MYYYYSSTQDRLLISCFLKDATYPSDEAFSYLVVSRGDWRQYTKDHSHNIDDEIKIFPRMISPYPAGRSIALDVDLCLPNGDCERVIFSKSGTDR